MSDNYLIPMIKQETKIGIREFQRNMAEISKRVEKGEEFIVMKHSEIVFKVIPGNKLKPAKKRFQWIEDLQFSSGENDTSQRVDEFAYEDRR
jgi:antitoxin (DNA-binding transcriptional repressor) of toxin-antitoxin stability system